MSLHSHNGLSAAHPWPDIAQALLLRAALAGSQDAREAWAQWQRATAGQTLDADSHRILPLLYRNLQALDVDADERARLKSVYLRYWSENQVLFAEAEVALRALGEHGIDTLVLKGLALTVAHYRDGGTRPMNDVDILVRPEDAQRAFDILLDLGYVPTLDEPFERQRRTRHAIAMHNDVGRQLDLHWYALYLSVDDTDLWRDSVALTIGDVPTRTLSAADQLMHVCVHGVSGECPGPMRWIADGVTVIRTAGERLHWQRLVRRATACGCTVALGDALAHLAQYVAVPRWVIDSLRIAPHSRSERLAHRAAVRPFPYGNRYVLEWDRYRRRRAARLPGAEPNFAAHLVTHLDLRGYGELVRLLARAGLRVARHGDRRAAVPVPPAVATRTVTRLGPRRHSPVAARDAAGE